MTNTMDERSSWKKKNYDYGRQRYRQLNNELRREAAKAKDEWWSKECAELEELDSQERSDLVYAKVAKITWKKKMTSNYMGVMNSAGNTVTESEEVRETSRQYIESLYDKDGKPKIEDLQVEKREEVDDRSEEHTSELQSLAYLVCRLLLEKKKKITQMTQCYISIAN